MLLSPTEAIVSQSFKKCQYGGGKEVIIVPEVAFTFGEDKGLGKVNRLSEN